MVDKGKYYNIIIYLFIFFAANTIYTVSKILGRSTTLTFRNSVCLFPEWKWKWKMSKKYAPLRA